MSDIVQEVTKVSRKHQLTLARMACEEQVKVLQHNLAKLPVGERNNKVAEIIVALVGKARS
jgi:predicted metallopeptidase